MDKFGSKIPLAFDRKGLIPGWALGLGLVRQSASFDTWVGYSLSSRAVNKPNRSFRPPSKAPGVRMRVGQYRLSPTLPHVSAPAIPWVFRDALGSRGVAEPTGAVVELITGNQEFVGRGYVDQEHAIAVRCSPAIPASGWSPGRASSACVSRAPCSCAGSCWGGQPMPSAMRLFTGESEGLPGVTVDRYGEFVVVQWLSQGALGWRDELYDAIETTAKPRGIYEQRRFRPLAGQAPPEPAVRARGDEAPLEIVVEDGPAASAST